MIRVFCSISSTIYAVYRVYARGRRCSRANRVSTLLARAGANGSIRAFSVFINALTARGVSAFRADRAVRATASIGFCSRGGAFYGYFRVCVRFCAAGNHIAGSGIGASLKLNRAAALDAIFAANGNFRVVKSAAGDRGAACGAMTKMSHF